MLFSMNSSSYLLLIHLLIFCISIFLFAVGLMIHRFGVFCWFTLIHDLLSYLLQSCYRGSVDGLLYFNIGPLVD